MKIYLAAPYAARDNVRQVRAWLQRCGHVVTSQWLNEEHELNAGSVGTSPASTAAYARQHSKMDMDDVHRSEVLVMLTEGWVRNTTDVDPSLLVPSGGRHVEMGAALAYGLPVIIVGEPENIFQRGMTRKVRNLNDLQQELSLLSTDPAPAGKHRA